jgi:WD40 repeat protein
MYVLETGFTAVQAVALGAGGAVAVVKFFDPYHTPVWTEFAERGYVEEEHAGLWQARLWPKRGAKPVEVTVDEGDPFGLAIDPFDGTLVHGNPRYGVGRSPNILLEPNVGGPPRSFAFSPDGKRLILGCGWERFRGKTTPAQLHGFTRKKVGKRWMIDQKPDATDSGDGFEFFHVAYLPDGERVAAIEWSKRKGGGAYIRGEVPTLSVHAAGSLDVLDTVTFKSPADGLCVCGERVIVKAGNVLKVWYSSDLSAKPVVVKSGKTTAVAADRHGRFVLTASKATVRVWDTSNWTVANTFDWQVGPITCLAVSPDGSLAAAGSATGKVVVWDVE